MYQQCWTQCMWHGCQIWAEIPPGDSHIMKVLIVWHEQTTLADDNYINIHYYASNMQITSWICNELTDC